MPSDFLSAADASVDVGVEEATCNGGDSNPGGREAALAGAWEM